MAVYHYHRSVFSTVGVTARSNNRVHCTAVYFSQYDISVGRLHSLDWTSGLDWWTDTKNNFLHFLTRLTHLWSCVEPYSLLCNYTVALEQIIY